MVSRIFNAVNKRPNSPRGRGHHSPSKVLRVPEQFLHELDTLIDSALDSCASSLTSPRYQKLREFLAQLESIIPPVK